MGKKWKRSKKGGDGAAGPDGSWDRRAGRKNYKDIPRENAAFEKYYKAQSIVDPSEWDAFMGALRRSLPTTFRITGTRDSALEVLRQFEDDYFSHLETATLPTGETVEPPRPIDWYPDKLAWHITAPRQFIRKAPQLKTFHEFLKKQAEQGNISRQEAVSMIPPLLLDVQPEHKVLDMCAAPGSKTAQLVEMVHGDGDAMPEGFVVANDADYKRCYLLMHQVKRLQSANFMITNHDASIYPTLYTGEGEGRSKIMFDRVLADVPCSGDGTLRKNMNIWPKWNPNNALGLHPLQLRIAERGLHLLDVGGLMVYSTCSFNPVENEAVIAALLKKHQGCVELVDVSDKLPNLKRSPGISSWSLMMRNGAFLKSFDEVQFDKPKMTPTMFPPSPEDVEWMNLDRCCRLLPHNHDTGGFFVAVLRKTQPLGRHDGAAQAATKAKSAPVDPTETGADDIDATADILPSVPEKAFAAGRENPYIFLSGEAEKRAILDELEDFYGLTGFPRQLVLTRSEGGKKNQLYMISEFGKALLEANLPHGLRVVNTGVRVFTRTDNRKKDVYSPFRLCQEGASIIVPYMTKRVIQVSATDLFRIMQEDTPFVDTLSAPVQRQLLDFSEGAIALKVAAGEPKLRNNGNIHCDVLTVGWRGQRTVRCLIAKPDRMHFKLLMGSSLEEAHDDEIAEKTLTVVPLEQAGQAQQTVQSEQGVAPRSIAVTAVPAEIATKPKANVHRSIATPAMSSGIPPAKAPRREQSISASANETITSNGEANGEANGEVDPPAPAGFLSLLSSPLTTIRDWLYK
eukprot:m.78659 g.78659  ORF g.78659 m.78659 type:complete len:797 (-) comp12542_c0_seq1:1531-3921(-)